MKLGVIPSRLTGRIVLADREHFLCTTNTRTMEVHVITFYSTTSLHGVTNKRMTFHGTRIRKDGTGGDSMKVNFFYQGEAFQQIPDELIPLIQEEFLVFDKLEARLTEALEEHAP